MKSLNRHAQLIEVFNGPGTKNAEGLDDAVAVTSRQYLQYLNHGFRLGPTGDQDNHFFTWGTLTDVRTGVIAPQLTKADILAALKARHVYATRDRNLRFLARVVIQNHEHLMGDVIAPPPTGTPFEIRYDLE